MGYRRKIQQQLSNYSVGERKIANYVLNYPEQLKSLSSQALADQLQISQSSIIKFVKKIGFKGYADFKILLTEEWVKEITESKQVASLLHNTINYSDPLQVIAQKLLIEKQKTLTDTTNAIDYSLLDNVLAHIRRAKRVHITGLGTSSLVAKDLAYKLLKLGYCVIMDQDAHVQITIAQSLTAEDLQIALSFSGRRREIVKAAQVAKESGATVIALTGLQPNPLRDLADFSLDTIADEVHWRSSPVSARTAQNVIIDIIFFGLLQTDQYQSQRALKQSQSLIDEFSLLTD